MLQEEGYATDPLCKLIGLSRSTYYYQRVERSDESALRRAIEAIAGEFRSLHESIDTTSAGGKLQFHIFSALAEFERDLSRERTMAGLRAARARGQFGGRRREMSAEKVKMAASLMKDKIVSVPEICKTLGISRSTLYRYVGPTGEMRRP